MTSGGSASDCPLLSDILSIYVQIDAIQKQGATLADFES
jgi:hypothetical protein